MPAAARRRENGGVNAGVPKSAFCNRTHTSGLSALPAGEDRE